MYCDCGRRGKEEQRVVLYNQYHHGKLVNNGIVVKWYISQQLQCGQQGGVWLHGWLQRVVMGDRSSTCSSVACVWLLAALVHNMHPQHNARNQELLELGGNLECSSALACMLVTLLACQRNH